MQTLTQHKNKPLSEVEARQAEASSVALQHLLSKDDQSLEQVTVRVSKEQEEADRHRGLDALAAEAQKLGMY